MKTYFRNITFSHILLLLTVLLLVTDTSLIGQGGAGNIRRENIKQVDAPGKVGPGHIGLVEQDNRSYLLWVPSTYRKDKSFDLVVFLHGVGSNGWSYYLVFRGKQILFPNALLLMPNGTVKNKPHRGNVDIGIFDDIYSWPRQGDKLDKAAKSVADSVRSVQKSFSVERTYMGGHSNGGRPASRTAMNHPDLFDGLLVWEGAVPRISQPDRAQKRIPVALIWGSQGSTQPEKVKSSKEMLRRRQQLLERNGLIARGFFLKGNRHGGFEHNGKPFYDEAYSWLSSVTEPPEDVLETARKWKKEGKKEQAREALKLLLRRKNLSSSVRKKAEKLLKNL